MKIRIFSLAKELNVDSKVLLDYCQKLGIVLKPSALASITEEERDRVLDLMKESRQSSSPQEVVAPVREPARMSGGKVPAVKPIAPPVRSRKEAPVEVEPEPQTLEPQPEPVPEVVAAPVVEAPVVAPVSTPAPVPGGSA